MAHAAPGLCGRRVKALRRPNLADGATEGDGAAILGKGQSALFDREGGVFAKELVAVAAPTLAEGAREGDRMAQLALTRLIESLIAGDRGDGPPRGARLGDMDCSSARAMRMPTTMAPISVRKSRQLWTGFG